MRYSGLRIGDAVTCERERLVKSKLFLYQAKTGTPVYCPLPPVVIDALNQVEGSNPKYFFWTGNGPADHGARDPMGQHEMRELVLLGGEPRPPRVGQDGIEGHGHEPTRESPRGCA